MCEFQPQQAPLEALTSETLQYWKDWYRKSFEPSIELFSTLKEAGSYWVYRCEKAKIISFDQISLFPCQKYEIKKVSKLKIGDIYRKDAYGYIVPDKVIENFWVCRNVSEFYLDLRRNAINVTEKVSWDGYAKIKALSPEKMQQLIDIFQS